VPFLDNGSHRRRNPGHRRPDRLKDRQLDIESDIGTAHGKDILRLVGYAVAFGCCIPNGK